MSMIRNQALINYISENIAMIEQLSNQNLENFAKEILQNCTKRDFTLWIVGNGGSAANASHASCDISKGVSELTGFSIRAICLNDMQYSISAWENDYSHTLAFRKTLEIFLRPGDTVLYISGSGRSQNIICAADYSTSRGDIKNFSMTGFDGGELKKLVPKGIHVNSHDMQVIENIHLICIHWIYKYWQVTQQS